MKWDELIMAYVMHLPRCKTEEKREEQKKEIERLKKLQEELRAA